MVKKRIAVKIPKDFEASVTFGSSVNREDTLGFGTKEFVLEAYYLPAEYELKVDPGVYVQKGDVLLEYKDGVEKVRVLAQNDGLVKLADGTIKIVDVVSKAPYVAPVSGRVVLLGREEIVIEAEALELPLFVGEGGSFRGNLIFLDSYKKKILDKYEGQEIGIIWGHSLTYPVFLRFLQHNITTILTPFITWEDYKKIRKEVEEVQLGILLGFGGGPLASLYKDLFKQCSPIYSQVDFDNNKIFLFNCDIMHSKEFLVAFKDSKLWGAEVEKLRLLEQEYWIAEVKGENNIVNLDELFKYEGKK